ncbi:MAG: AbgT family transporter [Bacilli bacterium]|nr:AbgT family transporter [Bacilli bacterium]
MKHKNRHLGPVTSILIIMLIVMIVTSLLSIIGYDGKQTEIINGTLESHLITVNNIFSADGLKYFFSNALTNFQNFAPLFYMVISLITVGIMDKSGLIKSMTQKVKKLKFKYLTILILIISILFTYIGEYSYAFLIPLIALIYKKIGKNPIIGIITVFSGLTFGYSFGCLYNNYTLGILTEASARLDVDANYTFSLLSTIYLSIFAAIIIVIISANIIEKRTALKFNNQNIEEDDTKVTKEANQYTMIAFISCIIILIFTIIPSQFSGVLLDKTQIDYVEKLFSSTSPFGQGLPYIILFIAIICSLVYGRISKNLKTSLDFNEAFSSSFDKTGYIFALMFFVSQLIGLIDWTNIGNVIASNLVEFMSSLEFSGIPLIILTMIITIFITLLIPNTMDKWVIFSPLIIPLFMGANITPDFTQLIFGVSDGIGKMLTPIFPYYVITLGMIYKYKDKNDINLSYVIKLLLPLTLTLAGVLLLLLVSWFLIGLPLGVNILPSL